MQAPSPKYNRLATVEKVTGDCTYDGTTTKRYYSISGMMVAMHDGTDLVYFANDHLSSASIVMNDTGGLLSQNRYMPFGEIRTDIASSPITQTDFGYTGQRNLADIGLMDYNARFYSPTLMRFIQPDTVIPGFESPQSMNRFTYTLNNPVKYYDPSGNSPCYDGDCLEDRDLRRTGSTILFGGGDGVSPFNGGPAVDYSMPGWLKSPYGHRVPDKNKIQYQGVVDKGINVVSPGQGKAGGAIAARGLLPDSSVNIIGVSAGGESALMYAVWRLQNGLSVDTVVILGSSLWGGLTFGGDAVGTGTIDDDLVIDDWADHIDYLTSEGVDVLLVNDYDSDWSETQDAAKLNPRSPGRYSFRNETNLTHDQLRNGALYDSVYKWINYKREYRPR